MLISDSVMTLVKTSNGGAAISLPLIAIVGVIVGKAIFSDNDVVMLRMSPTN